eukprot:6425462-Prymnesium_polylepis.1
MQGVAAFVLLPAVLGFGNSKKSIEILSPTNADQLKQVFFSGEPWLVQCQRATSPTMGTHARCGRGSWRRD